MREFEFKVAENDGNEPIVVSEWFKFNEKR